MSAAPERLTEAEAIATLRVIAALHGGTQHVSHLLRWPPGGTRSRELGGFDPVWIGLCLVADVHDFSKVRRWVWLRETGDLRECRTADIGGEGVIIPAGRIDRGLGAVK